MAITTVEHDGSHDDGAGHGSQAEHAGGLHETAEQRDHKDGSCIGQCRGQVAHLLLGRQCSPQCCRGRSDSSLE